MEILEVKNRKSEICESILRALPDWFGIEEAIKNYVREVSGLPMFVAKHAGRDLGFLSINFHNGHTAEIHVMGILQDHHRQGIGKLLIQTAEDFLRKKGFHFFTVKTLSPSRACEHYEKTRQFYQKMGFQPLEEFKSLWGPGNPCLFMAKALDIKAGTHGTPDWMPPVLKTRRLLLRPVQESDAESIFEYAKNQKVSLYTLWEPHQTIQESREFITKYVFPNYEKRVPEPWAITVDDKMIGTVGCVLVSKNHKSMELTYGLAEDQWGKGITVEASKTVLDWIFRELSPERIQARCKIENKSSARVMEKLGMKFEGTHRSEVFHRNRYWDMHYYSVLKSDWKCG